MVFVDETGHEELADLRFPVFGLGGCVSPSSLYTSNVKQPWLSLKAKYFGDATKPLHACEARDYSGPQKEAIGEFFRTQRFGRFAAVLKNTTRFPDELLRYQMIAGCLEERLRFFAAMSEFEGVVMIFESSQRADHLAEKYFSNVRLHNIRQRQIPVTCYFMLKSQQEAGLQVADFVMNAVGCRAHDRSLGKNNARKDFQCIFQNVEEALTSFFEIDSVDFQKRLQTLPPNLKDLPMNVSDLEPKRPN